MRLLAPLLVGLGALLSGATLGAQPSTTRRGWTASAGIGPGSAGVKCFDCITHRVQSASGFLRLGWSDSNRVYTAQARRWSKSSASETDNFNFYMGGLQYYPLMKRARGLYLEGAFGYADLAFHNYNLQETSRIRSSVVGLGMGYDIAIARTLFVTPYVSALSTSSATPTVNGTEPVGPHVKVSANLIQFGASIGWQRFGRRRYIPAGER